MESHICVPDTELRAFVERIFLAADVPARTSRLVADSLVAANLRGVDSHGVQLTLPYLERIRMGDINPCAEGRVVSESGCCLLYDGENGLGQRISEIACAHAVRIARGHGMALVSVRESNHFGAAAYWAQKIAAAGHIGMVMCNASTLVPPWQGREPRLGTNPICVAAPGPWLLDMATTTVAMNRIFKVHADGQGAIPAGWALNAAGLPTNDPAEAIHGMPMPLGGYKGSGLAMMVELLCSVLSGGASRDQLGGIRVSGRKARTSQMFLAIDIERFMPVDQFTARLETLVALVKSSAPADGFTEVLVAGEPEWRMESERRAGGIPLGRGTWDRLVRAGHELGVTAPVG